VTESEERRPATGAAANTSERALRRGVSIALGVIAAAAVAAGAYRYLAPPTAPRGASAGATLTLGGQRFVRHATPQPLPAVAFTDGEGRGLSLAQFRGRVVLLNVWATWCAPCRKEMPTLDRLQARFGDWDFEVVALSIDAGGTVEIRKFFRQVGIQHLRIYNDPSTDVTARLNIVGVPATLLIDSAGREIGRALGPAEWDAPDVVEMIRGHLGTVAAKP
jgi:thiol-disulfide isomerase/thioredoxin